MVHGPILVGELPVRLCNSGDVIIDYQRCRSLQGVICWALYSSLLISAEVAVRIEPEIFRVTVAVAAC